MGQDAMDLWRMARPSQHLEEVAADPRTFRQAGRFTYQRVSPADPGYRAMIPPPPCTACGEDHVPGQTYSHDYAQELPPATLPPVVPTQSSTPLTVEATTSSSQRVAVYNGRSDDAFVVVVESAPDWDTLESWKLDGKTALVVTAVAHALGVKVSDKTGGELAALRASES